MQREGPVLRQEEQGRVGPFFVGLDLSLRGAGVCVLDGDGKVIHSQKLGYALGRSARLKDKIERMLSIAKGVVRVVDEYTVLNDEDLLTKRIQPSVGIEGYAFGKRGNATIDLGELGGVVKSQLWLRFTLEPTLIAATSGRKVVLGNGRIPKKEVIPRLAERGFRFADHDIADAYVIAETMRQRSPQTQG